MCHEMQDNVLSSFGGLPFATSPAKPLLTFVYTKNHSSVRYLLSTETGYSHHLHGEIIFKHETCETLRLRDYKMVTLIPGVY